MTFFSPKKSQKGFTLIETLVSILVLAICVDAVMSLAAQGFFSIRYAKNQMVANALAQEALEYIRNRRDTVYQQGGTWDQWRSEFNVDRNGQVSPLITNADGSTTGTLEGCWSHAKTGRSCVISPYATGIRVKECRSFTFLDDTPNCTPLTYYPSGFGSNGSGDQFGFYGYSSESGLGDYPSNMTTSGGYDTSFIRYIEMGPGVNSNQAVVDVSVSWLDGNTRKSISQSMILANWNP